MTDQDIQFTQEGGWGVITLSRPKALNSLTAAMCAAMDAQLRAWSTNDSVKAILIHGQGERAFCAGGDIRWLATTAKENAAEAATFFRTEYKLNNLIAHYSKPYIALVHGVCMGGGVGVSAMATRRVMTEGVTWAMPECGIGLMPDVGASYFLNQLADGVGLYLGLTGHRLKGADCKAAGLATHVVADDALDAVRANLLKADLSADPLAAIDAALAPDESRAQGAFEALLPSIAEHFGQVSSLADLMVSLSDQGDFGATALKFIQPGSPTSQALTLKLLNEAPGTFSECIVREFCVAAHLMEGPDFLEGVRAQIIDKDRDPKWQPASLADVDPARIDWYFTEPEGGMLTLG